jgi:hypothetical protein
MLPSVGGSFGPRLIQQTILTQKPRHSPRFPLCCLTYVFIVTPQECWNGCSFDHIYFIFPGFLVTFLSVLTSIFIHKIQIPTISPYLPSGNLPVCYWKWHIYIWFTLKNGDFPWLFVCFSKGIFLGESSQRKQRGPWIECQWGRKWHGQYRGCGGKELIVTSTCACQVSTVHGVHGSMFSGLTWIYNHGIILDI